MKTGEILVVMGVYGIDCGDGCMVHISSKLIKIYIDRYSFLYANETSIK